MGRVAPTSLSAPILSMLEALNYLMKFLQQITCFVFDMIAAIKLYQANLFSQYIDLDTAQSTNVFQKFKDVMVDTSDVIVLMHDMNLECDCAHA